MRAYVITTAALFGLLTAAHLWRMVVERHLASEPWYVLITVATAALCVWGSRLLRASTRARP